VIGVIVVVIVVVVVVGMIGVISEVIVVVIVVVVVGVIVSGCSGDCMQFKGPGFKYLMWLWQWDKSNAGSIYTFLQNNINSLWNLARDTQYNTFSIDWAGPPQTTIYASQQNSAVTATNLFALYCNQSSTTDSLPWKSMNLKVTPRH